MSSGAYNTGIQKLCDRSINWGTDDIRAILIKVGAGFVFDRTALTLAAALGSPTVEFTATGYARAATAGRTISALDDNTPVVWALANTLFAGIGGILNQTADGVLLYKHTGSDATGIPIWFGDAPTNLVSNGSDIIARYHATLGIFSIGNLS